MRVAVDPSEVEELAWLVKDNVYTKHLILSAEELFYAVKTLKEFVAQTKGSDTAEGSSEQQLMDLMMNRETVHRLGCIVCGYSI